MCMLRPTIKLLPIETRREIVISKVLSKINYGSALFTGQTASIKRQLNTLTMECYRLILNENTYMIRNKIICKKVELPPPEIAINQAASNFVHKTLKSKLPLQVYKQYKRPMRPRGCFKIRPIIEPKTMRMERILFFSSIEIYNRVPEPIRCLEYPQFRRRIKEVTWGNI